MERIRYPGLDFPDYPPLQLSDQCRSMVLPSVHDNSGQPYLRPVFRQQGASCGQAASVAYNFCYEINRLRGLPSDTSIHQYPSHFVWNFMNGTLPYYGEGVSYFHTFDVLYDAGCPTEDIYGPITMDDSYYWMNGYDGYFRAMHNRVSGMNSIHAGTPEGLLVLKHWLHNHLEGAEVGGVANFYAGYLNYLTIPPGTPEAGKFINISFYEYATHALTIVGYNDSVRFDVNNDGIFTNHLDITGDGKVDMSDWEIGALKFVNSYGDTWADSGFCYMLYRTLAMKYGQGGIWNNSVHVLTPDTAYRPLLTIKARVAHNKRGRIKLTAGLSADTANYYPDHTISFSVFNYQGLDYPMAGNESQEGKTLEIGLDITPLLSYIKPGTQSRIFLMVDENDPDGSGRGRLLDFSVLDYHLSGTTEFKCNDTPLELLNNDLTLASVVIEVANEPIQIIPDSTIVVEPGKPCISQLVVNGGKPPYRWELLHLYDESGSVANFSPPQGETQIPTNPENGFSVVPLPFRFPYFGREYDTLYMHVNGYIMTEKQDMPYYYLLFDELYLKQVRAIACYMNKDLALHQIQDNYMTVAAFADKVIFNWRISDAEGLNYVTFSATITPDGTIRIHYGSAIAEKGFYPVTGLSNGSANETIFSEFSGCKAKEGRLTTFIPSELPPGIFLDNTGILTIEAGPLPFSGEIGILVTDASRQFCEKRFTVTTGPEMIIRQADPSQIHEPGTTIPLNIEINNHAGLTWGNLTLSLAAASGNIKVQGGPVSGIELKAGQSLILEDVFSATLSDTIIQPQAASVIASLSSDTHTFRKVAGFRADLPLVKVYPPVFNDGENQLADPGEEADLLFTVMNYGSAPAGILRATLILSDAFAAIAGNPVQEIGELSSRSRKTFRFRFKVNDAAPEGRLVALRLKLGNPETIIYDEIHFLNLGIPVILIADMDKNNNSALHIEAAMRELSIGYENTRVIDSSLFDYKYSFLCLGHYPQNHMLTTREDSLYSGFLTTGKGLYLEGGSFFKFNPPTMLREMTRTQGAYDSWGNWPDTLAGVPGMPVDGIQFDYTGDWTRTENLLAQEPAVPWFRDINSGLDFVTALDSGYYKVISSSVEFGGTSMYSGPGRRDLMKRYLEFLGYRTSPLSVTFQASTDHLCRGSVVGFVPVSSGQPTSYHWDFPGGTPGVWDGPAPVIRYDSAGLFSVSVTVSDGPNSNTFTINELIAVDDCAGTEDPYPAKAHVYPNPAGEFVRITLAGDVIHSVSVLDMQGRILLSERYSGEDSAVMLPLSGLTSGLYLVTVKSESCSATSKLLVY